MGGLVGEFYCPNRRPDSEPFFGGHVIEVFLQLGAADCMSGYQWACFIGLVRLRGAGSQPNVAAQSGSAVSKEVPHHWRGMVNQ